MEVLRTRYVFMLAINMKGIVYLYAKFSEKVTFTT